jgi:hypothetical protein
MLKSKALNFCQLLLNLTDCAAPQTDTVPRYPWTRFNTRAVPLVLSSLVHNSYYLKLKAGRN